MILQHETKQINWTFSLGFGCKEEFGCKKEFGYKEGFSCKNDFKSHDEII